MNIQQAFGQQPTQLQDFQVEWLKKLHDSFYVMAQTIVANTRNVPEREKALEALKAAKVQAEAAAREPRSILDPGTLATLFQPTEARNTRVARVWLTVTDYADVRKYGREILDMETDVAKLRQGIQGRVWGAEIRTSRKIPAGLVMIVGEDQGDADLETFSPNSDMKPFPEQLTRI